MWDYHYPRTQAGIQRAYKNFNAATMANSHTTIVEWAAHVGRLATILRTTGGSADEAAELCVLLEGLLPEFKSMKLHLEQSDGLSLVDARRRLINHASTEGLSELRRGGKGTESVPCQGGGREKEGNLPSLDSRHLPPEELLVPP